MYKEIEKDIPLIKYKGVVHITGSAYQTDCGMKYPIQGKHLSTQQWGNFEGITCEKCKETIRAT